MDDNCYALHYELLLIIARCDNWRAWNSLRLSNKRLYADLSRDDAYAMFTTLTIIDPDLDEIWVGWRDHDGVDIRIAIESNCGFLILKYRDGRCMLYDYRLHLDWDTLVNNRPTVKSTEYYVNCYNNIHTYEDIKSFILTYNKPLCRLVLPEEEWQQIRDKFTYRKLIKSQKHKI
jgi:hypothetical protein